MKFELFNQLFFFSVMLGFPSQAKYGIFNDRGEQVYYAFEG